MYIHIRLGCEEEEETKSHFAFSKVMSCCVHSEILKPHQINAKISAWLSRAAVHMRREVIINILIGQRLPGLVFIIVLNVSTKALSTGTSPQRMMGCIYLIKLLLFNRVGRGEVLQTDRKDTTEY